MTENDTGGILKSRMFARQQLIDGWDQTIINDACILIIGVGALGCEIAKDFALMGIGKLILVDLDTIETSNLSRQMLFRPGDEGRPKAEVAAERLKLMNPFLKADYYFEKLQKLPMSVYQEADVVIAALDNFNARLDLNKICLITLYQWSKAYETKIGKTNTFWLRNNIYSPDWCCSDVRLHWSRRGGRV